MFIAPIYYALGECSPAKALYIQAFIGVMVVPLTYLLARRLLGTVPALGAAGMAALNGLLVGQAWNWSDLPARLPHPDSRFFMRIGHGKACVLTCVICWGGWVILTRVASQFPWSMLATVHYLIYFTDMFRPSVRFVVLLLGIG
jgi:hypothetical protein